VVRNFLNRQGLWHHLQTSQEAGHAAAIREGDPVAEARSLFGLALADSNMGRYAQAQTRLGRARTIFRQTGEQEAEERTTISIAGVFDLQGEWLAALNQYEPLLALHPRGTDRTARARILIGVSWAKVQLGRYAEAKADTLEIIGMGAHLRPFWLADTWDTLGRAQFGLGDLDEAAGSYRRAVELYQHHGAPVSAAESLRRLGDLLERAGRRPEAGQMYRQALVLAGQAGGPQAARLSAELSSVLAQHR
jgi:tetratricopeptide (TPR) repeat protein